MKERGYEVSSNYEKLWKIVNENPEFIVFSYGQNCLTLERGIHFVKKEGRTVITSSCYDRFYPEDIKDIHISFWKSIDLSFIDPEPECCYIEVPEPSDNEPQIFNRVIFQHDIDAAERLVFLEAENKKLSDLLARSDAELLRVGNEELRSKISKNSIYYADGQEVMVGDKWRFINEGDDVSEEKYPIALQRGALGYSLLQSSNFVPLASHHFIHWEGNRMLNVYLVKRKTAEAEEE